jgi:hypothetical protein
LLPTYSVQNVNKILFMFICTLDPLLFTCVIYAIFTFTLSRTERMQYDSVCLLLVASARPIILVKIPEWNIFNWCSEINLQLYYVRVTF